MLTIPRVKICGIKTKDEVEIINRFPVNYVGFIFAESKRQVGKEQVKVLRELLRKDFQAVGVFVNQDASTINEYIDTCHLDIIQLHGEENNDFCKGIKKPVWKAIQVKDKKSMDVMESYTHVEGFLLDTYHNASRGGTGLTFDWNIVKDVSKDRKIILAGGLTPDNVSEAIERVKPNIIDINSGVESNLYKDEGKIKKLFMRIKGGNNR